MIKDKYKKTNRLQRIEKFNAKKKENASLSNEEVIDIYVGLNKNSEDWEKRKDQLMKLSLDNINYSSPIEFDETYNVNIRINKKDLSKAKSISDYIETSGGSMASGGKMTDVEIEQLMKKKGKDFEEEVEKGIKSGKIKRYAIEDTDILGLIDEDYEMIKELEEEEKKGLLSKGGRADRPSPSESATEFPKGYQKIGNDGNWWEIITDYRGTHRWKKINAWEVKPQYKPQPKPQPVQAQPIQEEVEQVEEVEEVKIDYNSIQKELIKNGFVNEDLTLTNKGKRIVELHKFCFPLDTHPFSYIYADINDLYPDHKSQYLKIDKTTMYTGTQEIYEIGDNLPKAITESPVYNSILENQIALTKSNKIEYKPYSYCPSIEDGKTGIGFIVLCNYVNNTELYINAPTYNYAIKNHRIDKWYADSNNAVFVYGYSDDELKVVIRVQQKVIGLFDSFSLYDTDKTLNSIRKKYPELFLQGEVSTKFVQKSQPKISAKKEVDEYKKQTIAGLELMLELANTEEQKKKYQEAIYKLKN